MSEAHIADLPIHTTRHRAVVSIKPLPDYPRQKGVIQIDSCSDQASPIKVCSYPQQRGRRQRAVTRFFRNRATPSCSSLVSRTSASLFRLSVVSRFPLTRHFICLWHLSIVFPIVSDIPLWVRHRSGVTLRHCLFFFPLSRVAPS